MGARAARNHFPHTTLRRRQRARLDLVPCCGRNPLHRSLAEGAGLGTGKPGGHPLSQLCLVDHGRSGHLDGGTCYGPDLPFAEGSIHPPALTIGPLGKYSSPPIVPFRTTRSAPGTTCPPSFIRPARPVPRKGSCTPSILSVSTPKSSPS